MSGSIHDLVDDALAHAQAAWEAVVPADLGNLHDLPAHVAQSWDALVQKLTNNGTLNVPNPRDWLPEQLQPALPAPPPPPPPPPPSHASTAAVRAYLAKLAAHARLHPWICASVAVGLSGTASYLYAPDATRRTLLEPLINHLVPLALLPDPNNRPNRLVPGHHGVPGEIRKEAVVVLGADSPHGREIALDLERRGFVVVATVADPAGVDALERTSRGWLKVLVLDPQESSSVSPFLRSLSTALSLRFPLHSSGDPFSRPAHALALTGVVNCLSLSSVSPAAAADPYPLEATDNDSVRKHVGERVATVVGVVRGLLPILRSAAARPGAPTGVFLSLVPTASSNVSLPFAALASAADAAIASVLHSLRREVAASTSGSLVRLTILQVGFFQPAAVPTATATAASASGPHKPSPRPLPIRLESIYAPALLRRRVPAVEAGVEEHDAAGANLRGAGGAAAAAAAASSTAAATRRKGSEMRKLCKRVWKILVRPNHAGAVSRIGSGSLTYLVVSYLPHAVVDLCLSVQDRLYGVYLSHVRKLIELSSRRRWSRLPSAPTTASASTSGSGSSSTRPPLPTPPTSASAPSRTHNSNPNPLLRPGPAQVPLADPFLPPAPSSSASASSSLNGDEGGGESSSSGSSLEDFGPLGPDTGYGTASIGGSFVSVGRDDY
ncbi:hypothetical protein JCM3774_006413 [Rhodotorula dairenensis]